MMAVDFEARKISMTSDTTKTSDVFFCLMKPEMHLEMCLI